MQLGNTHELQAVCAGLLLFWAMCCAVNDSPRWGLACGLLGLLLIPL